MPSRYSTRIFVREIYKPKMLKELSAPAAISIKKKEPVKKVPRKDDLLWKGILEDVFEDFISFINPNAYKEYDLDKGFHFLDKELEQVFPPDGDQYNPKVIDKFVKVFTRTGQEEWILIHIEVQAKHSEDFGHRMFTYFYRIHDKYQKPICAYAILTDGVKKERPGSFNLSCQGTILNYQYNVFQIANQRDEDLLASANPFSLVVLTARIALSGKKVKIKERDQFMLDLKLKLAKELLSREIPKNKIRVLMNFLRYYVRFSDPKNNSIFEKELEKLTGRNNTMGIEELLLDRAKNEGIQEGRHEEALEIAREMKNDKFPIEKIVKLTRLSVDEIQAL